MRGMTRSPAATCTRLPGAASAFAKNLVWWVRDALDIERMREVAERFAGLKDFRSFTDDSAEEKSTLVADRADRSG